MALRIKTAREEFNSAANQGYVYGEIKRQKSFPVYVELGFEENYNPSPQDDPNTEYRIFRNCNVYIGENEEKLDQGIFIQKTSSTVIIYC